MAGTDPGSARREAERLVATVLAAARLATAGSRPGEWGPLGELVSGVLSHAGRADDGFGAAAECRVCPVCRAIAALRDPSPEFAERLATGAGDLAAGIASLLRAFAASGTAAEPGASAAAEPGASAAAEPGAAGESSAPSGGGSEPSPGEGEPSVAGSGSPTVAADRPGAPSPRSAAGSDAVWRSATSTGHDASSAPEPDVWAAATRGASTTIASRTGATPAEEAPAPGAGPGNASGDEA